MWPFRSLGQGLPQPCQDFGRRRGGPPRPGPGGEVHVLGGRLGRLVAGQGLDGNHGSAEGRERRAGRVAHDVKPYAEPPRDAGLVRSGVHPLVEVLGKRGLAGVLRMLPQTAERDALPPKALRLPTR